MILYFISTILLTLFFCGLMAWANDKRHEGMSMACGAFALIALIAAIACGPDLLKAERGAAPPAADGAAPRSTP